MRSHRQRQNLLVEFTDSFGPPDRNSEQICRELANTGAAFCSHFAQSGVHGCISANLDLLALTFMRLGHAVILAQDEPCTWYRHAGFVESDVTTESELRCPSIDTDVD